MTDSAKMVHTFFGSRTDVGCIRDHNEDSLVVTPPLFAVADGMGGHAAGEVASEIAIETLTERAPKHLDAEALGRAVVEANLEIISAAAEGRGRQGMGTTVTAAMVENERVIIAQVGDSRAYLLHQGSLQQVTRDHSLMADLIEAGQITPEEARVHPNRSVITRALGSNANMLPDLYEIDVESGDRLLLCSDGLSSMLEDREIQAILASIVDPQECASALVDAALAAGGHDNVTVIVVNIEGFAARQTKKVAIKTRAYLAFIIVALASLLCGTAYAFSWWVNTAAFLVEDNGVVSVYSGIPGEFLGMRLGRFDHVTDIKVSDLPPTIADRLKTDGVRVDSLDDANQLVETWTKELKESSSSSSSNSNANTNENSNSNANKESA